MTDRQNSAAANPLSSLLSPFLPAIRIWVGVLFSRWVGQGLFSPENATVLQQWVMDGVAFVPIAIWSGWAYWKSTRTQKILATNALPGVLGVAVTAELDKKIDDPTVATPEKLVREIAGSSKG